MTFWPDKEMQAPGRKRFTRAEVERMLDAGMFEGQRYELIDGDLIDRMGQTPLHANAIVWLTEVLARIFGIRRVLVQLPIEVSAPDQERSEPEPDLAVLASGIPAFRDRHPQGSELTLLVEAADTTVRHDLTTKRDLYARAGVPQYWLLDLGNRKLWIHRQPAAGRYESVTQLGETEETSLGAERLKVAELLPPSPPEA